MGSRSFTVLCTEHSSVFNSRPCILKQTHVQRRVTGRYAERSMNVLCGKETTWNFCFNVWKATVKKWHLPKKIRMRSMSLNCRRKILLERRKTAVTNRAIEKDMDALWNREHLETEWASLEQLHSCAVHSLNWWPWSCTNGQDRTALG